MRQNTTVDMSLVESRKQPAKSLIKERRKQFVAKKLEDRDMEEPFQKVYEMCKNMNTQGFRFLQRSIGDNPNDDSLEKSADAIKNMPESSTKFVTYRTVLNPELNTHPIYGKKVVL